MEANMRVWSGVGVLGVMLTMIVGMTGAVNGARYEPKAGWQKKQGGYVKGKFIYELEGRQTPECHASTIEEVKGGLVAAWFGGKHERNNDVGIWVSRWVKNKQGGKDEGTWTRPVLVATGAENEKRDFPCWNPVLFQPRKGPLLLFYKVGPSPSMWWGVVMESHDDGKTWKNRRKLGVSKKLGSRNPNLIGPVKNRPIQLENGDILCPSSSEHNRWRVHFERSSDGGKTWYVIGPIHNGKKYGAIQPSILSYKDGKMQILCRTRQGVVGESWSSDGGKTWTRVTGSTLPNPNAGTDGITLKDGRQLLVYNHTTRRGGFPSGRNMLNVAISNDGKTWKAALILERSKGEYSYPTVIQAKDGRVHVVYTWRRKTVKHVVIDVKKLKLTAMGEGGSWPE